MRRFLQFHRASQSGGSLATSYNRTLHFLRQQLWVWPIIAAVGLAGIAYWVYSAIDQAMQRQLAAEVITIRDAGVKSLRIWLAEEQANTLVLTKDNSIIQPIRGLLKIAEASEMVETALQQSAELNELREYLAPRLKLLGYSDFFVVSPKLQVIGSLGDPAIGSILTGYRGEFFSGILKGNVAVSLPYRTPLMLPDDKGELVAGRPTMFVSAPIHGVDGELVAALGLRIRPEGEFSDILRVARTGESGETYAFDRQGLLLSQSRFDDELKQIGLLADLPDSHSILTLEIRDPQVNMMAEQRPGIRRADQDLTRMATAAVAGETGVDVHGYRDYRGVPVIGAWTWIPEMNLGVASEIDAAEAFRPLYILRVTIWSMFGLLAASAVAIFVFMMLASRQQKALREAVLAARHLGQYTLEDKIGSGGMGTVYRARHALLRRPTAVKLLDVDKVNDLAVTRFEREVQLTSQLNHPNTIAIYDFGRTPEGLLFYAMEYLDGINLEDLVTRFGPIADVRVIPILEQVCGSIAEAHARGLIHRDIKPANVILNHRGGLFDFVKVLDFGLVKALGAEHQGNLTSAKSLTGTPHYLSPEAIESPDKVDTRTDIYSIGALGYFLLTGTPVFRGTTLVDICMQHVRTPPDPPSQRLGAPILPQLEAIILQCLEKDRERRPASAQAIADALQACQPGKCWQRADAEAWWVAVEQEQTKETHTSQGDSSVFAQTIRSQEKK